MHVSVCVAPSLKHVLLLYAQKQDFFFILVCFHLSFECVLSSISFLPLHSPLLGDQQPSVCQQGALPCIHYLYPFLVVSWCCVASVCV